MRAVLVATIVWLTAACSSEGPANAGEVRQWTLPDRLREVSGLALTADERLLAVADEFAVVYEIDYDDGHLVKAFALGSPPVPGDFEGIAVQGEQVWLMTSEGILYASREGDNGEQVDFERYDTGLEDKCEFEGLVAIQSRPSLALLCKDPKKGEHLGVYEWSIDDGVVGDFRLPEKDMEAAIGEKKLRPSGLEIDPVTGDWLVLAAAQHALFRISGVGELIDVIMRLDRERHRQAEGIALTRDGRLIIADEAAGRRATMAVYRMDDGE